jgi:MFS family permease
MSEAAVPRRNRFLLAQWAELMEQDVVRRFWLMRLAANTAVNAYSYALLVFTVRQSESAIATGGMLIAITLPSALFGALAGVVVDRLPRGLVLFLASGLRALLMFGLIAAKDTLPGIYAVSFALATVSQFTAPAEAAVVPHIVPARRLTSANSFLNLGSIVAQVLGMLVLAPLFLKTTDGDALLFILMGLFAFAAVMVTVIPQFRFTSTGTGGETTLRSMRREFAEGWLALGREPLAFLGMVVLVVASVATLVVATMVPKFATQTLAIAPENIVFVLAPAAVGVYLGLRSVEWLADHFNKLATLLGAFALFAGAIAGLGFVPATGDFIQGLDPAGVFSSGPLDERAARIAATVFYANVFGFAMTASTTVGKVLIHERLALNMQGRAFAAQSVLASLCAIPPVAIAGLVADTLGVMPVLITTGVVSALIVSWALARGATARAGRV